MTFDPKDDLRWYLQRARAAMVWKLDGLWSTTRGDRRCRPEPTCPA
jgi:hypothetical protein